LVFDIEIAFEVLASSHEIHAMHSPLQPRLHQVEAAAYQRAAGSFKATCSVSDDGCEGARSCRELFS
jgi:hypothetical protein